MNLIIDCGNSFTKTAIFEAGNAIDVKLFSTFSADDLRAVYKEFPLIKNAIISSVIHIDHEISGYLKAAFQLFIELNTETKLPIEIIYRTKQTLGIDRIASAVGANYLWGGSNLLIIDFGTAITIDFVSDAGRFEGGNISPGLQSRYRALHEFTQKLPLLSKTESFNLIGNSTNTAIVSGVQNGIIFEVEGYISRYRKQYNSLKIVFTGGDADFFAKPFKSAIFAEPNLVLIGLNRILEANQIGS